MCDKTLNLCNVNFVSQYASIEGIEISVNNYLSRNDKKEIGKMLKCNKGHELIFAHGNIKKPYFRHKNTNDVGGIPCTKWHTEWQGNFPITEYEFPKINETQIKNRRTDALLEKYNLVIEFQHSHITYQEVCNRKHDYNLHNKNILWIIHGQDSIKVLKFENVNRVYIEFIDNDWKYKSFVCYEYIYLDIDEKIYKLYPKDVKNNMIDILQENIYEKEQFIELLKHNDSKIHSIIKPDQCTLYLKQQGAGNGKTFGIIQMLESKEFEHYDCLIVVSKQHSAKYVIYNELKTQIDNGQLKNIKIVDTKEINKKYKIKFNNTKNNKESHLIIGTIDSLMYTLGNKNTKEYDKFKGLVNSIINGYIEDEKINAISYGSTNIRLNKKMCLIIDETQDLNKEYGIAIFEIMKSRYIDAYIVGDKLQSLSDDKNAFIYMLDNDYSYINKIICEKTNVCRRFYHPELVNLVNDIIPFERYELPKITPYKDANDYKNVVIPFKIANNNLNDAVQNILEYYIDAVNKYKYNPNDFLIITPFTDKNKIACSLEIAINNYWCDKFNTNIFTRYAIFHKSEEGTSINLAESENATRIVSIHTSKGDGRKAVFVIGLNEESLLKFSKETNNLIYNSLIHVALTRAKERIYIKIENEYDDIYKKLMKFCKENNVILECTDINISNKIRYEKIINLLKNNLDYNDIYYNIIAKTDNIKKLIDEKSDKEIIDLGHHCIRYASMLISLYLNIVANENNNKTESEIKRQIYAILNKISNMQVYNCETVKEYINNIDNKSDEILLSIVKIYDKGEDYINYNKIIYDFIISIKIKLQKIINKNNIINLCPYECIILHYMIEITQNRTFSSITITDLYNITDIYNKTFNNTILGHENCICKKKFKLNDIIDEKYDKINKYLLNHYEQIKKINKIYQKFLNDYKSTNWLISHRVDYNGTNNDFNIYSYFTMIGYNEREVYNIYIKPQVNCLNYNEILLDSIYDTHLINNCSNNNFDRFSNKSIKTIIFTFDNDSYYSIDWISNTNLISDKNAIIVDKLYQKILEYYNIKYNYIYNWYKNNKNKYINESSTLIITKIIEDIKNIIDSKKNKDMAHFIIKFFEGIETKLNFVKKSERNIELNKYDDNEYFICELNKIIAKSIKIFLNIPIIEEEDDE